MAELGIAEAARTLNVSVDTIRRRIKKGELRAWKDPEGRWTVSLEDETPAMTPKEPVEPAQSPDLESLKALLAEKERTIRTLEKQLEEDTRERAELRQMLMHLQTEVVKMLPAPPSVPMQQAPMHDAYATGPERPKKSWWKVWR